MFNLINKYIINLWAICVLFNYLIGPFCIFTNLNGHKTRNHLGNGRCMFYGRKTERSGKNDEYMQIKTLTMRVIVTNATRPCHEPPAVVYSSGTNGL